MSHLATRVREVVASNIDALVRKAEDRDKMLRLLRSEIESNIVSLQRDLSYERRAIDRCEKSADELDEAADEWTGKAKTAVDHDRKDLARAALLTRDDLRTRAHAERQHAAAKSERVSKIEAAVDELKARRQDVAERISELPPGDAGQTAHAACESTRRDSRADRILDRVDTLDQRAAFQPVTASERAPNAIGVEIEQLRRERDIEDELAAMTAPSKRKGGRRKAG